MESPNKRMKMSPTLERQEDFVSFGGDDNDGAENDQYGYGASNGLSNDQDLSIPRAPNQPRNANPGRFTRNAWNDPRNAKDRPKTKHAIPGCEPWILVKTKYGRRFAHNTETKQSLWRMPQDVYQAVMGLQKNDKAQTEKEANARWAEQQLREMRQKSKAEKVNQAADAEGRGRRRRSESLQKEDEAAMMAELAADAEHAEEKDAKEALKKVEELEKPWGGGYDSDSSYEEVEVTDDEGEEQEGKDADAMDQEKDIAPYQDGGPVEFGEDDIAYQLAAMGEDYGLDEGEYGSPGSQEGWEEGAEGLPISDEDATNLFRDMLDDHRISPFTPWDRLIADESEEGILMDDRYTVLANMRARKEAWEAWVKDTAARLKEDRAKMEKLDPRIPYLAFLAEKATPKLYWPEFKRKYKRESALNDRKLSDNDREKIYRDHINRLKLPESTRKADYMTLLTNTPLSVLNKTTTFENLPSQILSHLHYISLPTSTRDALTKSHIASLPPPPDTSTEEGELWEEQRLEDGKKRDERRRREEALAERERRVGEERRRAEEAGRWAKKDLLAEERSLAEAMRVDRRGLAGELGGAQGCGSDVVLCKDWYRWRGS